MARSLEEIYSDLLAKKAARPELNVLTSTSNTAIWRLILYICALGIYTHEMLWDIHAANLESIIEGNTYGTNAWWVYQCKKFQYGYSLQVNDNFKTYYLVDDPGSRIIKYVSVTKVGNELVIKVATSNSGNAEKLNSTQLTAFISYVKLIAPAGTNYSVISYDADVLDITTGKFYYNPELDLNAIKSSFDDCLNAYLLNLDFNGDLYYDKFIDAIQSVTGYKDFECDNVLVKTNSASTYSVLGLKYNPISGYIKPVSTLSLRVTFIPSI